MVSTIVGEGYQVDDADDQLENIEKITTPKTIEVDRIITTRVFLLDAVMDFSPQQKFQ